MAATIFVPESSGTTRSFLMAAPATAEKRAVWMPIALQKSSPS